MAHVATTKGSNNTPGTSFNTASITPSTGELLLLGLISYRTGGDFTTNSVSWNSTALAQDKTITFNNGVDRVHVELWSLPNLTGAASTGTVNYSASVDFKTYFWMRVSGAATASITDSAGGSASGTGTAVATGSFSSVASDDFWVCVMGCTASANPSTVTAAAAWTIDTTNGRELNGATNMVGGMEYIANPGVTSENGQFTITSSNWAAVGMAYKAAGGAAATWGPLLGLYNNRLVNN